MFFLGQLNVPKYTQPMQIIYVGEAAPASFTKAIFLAGPTPRSADVPSWRPEALKLLEAAGYDGVVFVPERKGGFREADYTDQVEWEETHLNMCDCAIFWIPRNMATFPGLTTNDEWGGWKNSGKVILGTPDGAEHVRYQQHYAAKYNVPTATTLEATISLAVIRVGDGALRTGGERTVPLMVWNTPSFQQWYRSHQAAGNRLDGAKVHWTFRVGPKKNIVFMWILHVDIFIAAENRHKVNEFVIARPDISTVVMYQKRPDLMASKIVLIREFRSPVSNDTGFVWEVPGGSTFKGVTDPKMLAADECEEEAGIRISPERIVQHEARQLVATLSTHRAHLFSVEITDEEVAALRAQHGVANGVAEDSERTYVEILTLAEILDRRTVDWSILGMILSVLQK